MRVACLLLVLLGLANFVQAQSCPEDCSGHGSCDRGYCSCYSGYSGNDCSIETTTLTNGVEQTASVGHFEWHFYQYSLSSQGELLWSVQSTEGDCDLYISYEDEPSRSNFMYNDLSLNNDFSITIQSSDPRGIYIAGIYGFSACDYTIVATEESSCPSACSSHGVCNPDTGVCTCNNGWAGEDCATADLLLVAGVQTSGHADHYEWKQYHIDVPSSENTLNFEMTSTGDCDLYVRYQEAPTLFNYDVVNATQAMETSIAMEDVSPGPWFVGIYGYEACDFDITASYAEVPCPGSCSGTSHGTCSGSACRCTAAYDGDECERRVTPLLFGETVQGFVADNLWNYYTFTTNTQAEITITVDEQNEEGDCDIYVRNDEDPTRHIYDYLDISTPQSSSIVIADPGQADLHIGIYGWSACTYSLTVAESTSCSGCSGHGTCNADFDCICNSGWGGVECETAIVDISNNQKLSDQEILPNEWKYYKFTTTSSIIAVTLNEVETIGDVWIYLSPRSVPDLNDIDLYDHETNTGFHKIVYADTEAEPSSTDWYIGVYGSPLGHDGVTAVFDISVFFTDF